MSTACESKIISFCILSFCFHCLTRCPTHKKIEKQIDNTKITDRIIDYLISFNRHTKIDKKYPILIGTTPLFSSPYTSWYQVDDTQPTAPIIDYEPPMSIGPKPMPIPIAESPNNVTDLSTINEPNPDEFQLKNQPIGSNIRESK